MSIADEDRVTLYRFGHETADFHVCGICGIVPIATSAIDESLYAVVNVNTFEDVEPEEFERAATNFDGEETSGRLARRKRNWTPTTISRPAA